MGVTRQRVAAPAQLEQSDSMRVEIVAPKEVPNGRPVPLTLKISNSGKRPIELYLAGRPTAFDLIVKRGDSVVWRRLEGATVSAILGVRTLAPAEAIELNETWDQRDNAGQPVGPGEYTVSGSVLTDRTPLLATPAPLRIGG